MMKKILLTILMLIPFNVFALEGSMILECDKTTVNPGDRITCNLKGNVTGDTVTGVSSTITTSNKDALTLDAVTINKELWQGDGVDGDVDLYTSENKEGIFEIATFTLIASSNIKTGANVDINIDDNTFSDSSFSDTKIGNATKTIRIASTENTLSNLSVVDGNLIPAFNKDTLDYTVEINKDKTTINATATDSNSKISGDIGVVNLNYGENKFKIKITSEANATKTYTITIMRPDTRDKNNSISSLKLNDQEITLIDNEENYTYEVDNEITEVKIEAILSSDKASFLDGYEPKTVTLNEGSNVVEIKVIAENETTKTYTITINRKSKVVTDTPTNNSQTKPNNNNNNQKVENPKTGDLKIFVIMLIAILSIAVILVMYKKYSKKEGNINEEK